MNKNRIHWKFIRMKYVLQAIKEGLEIITDADQVLKF